MGSLMTGCNCVGRGRRAALKEKWRLIDVGDEESAHLKTVRPLSSHYPGRHLSVIPPPSSLQLHFLLILLFPSVLNTAQVFPLTYSWKRIIENYPKPVKLS